LDSKERIVEMSHAQGNPIPTYIITTNDRTGEFSLYKIDSNKKGKKVDTNEEIPEFKPLDRFWKKELENIKKENSEE
jgi:hypothetical protein